MRWDLCVVAALLALAGGTVQAETSRAKPARATTCGPLDDHEPAWSPRGRTIAFSREVTRPRVSSAVFRIGADGRRLIRLSPAVYDYARYPAWSPDAAHVAFEHFGLDAVVHIVVVTALGRSPVEVASWPWQREPPDPQLAWHPDGKRLAFSHDGGIFVARVDGSGVHRLVDGTSPAWSPDGSRLAYITGDGRLAVGPSDGSRFSTVAGKVAPAPRWSPDGTRLAYAFATRDSSWSVGVVDASSGRGRMVVKAAANPAWSPDGRRLVVGDSYSWRARRRLRVVDVMSGRVVGSTRDASRRYGADDFSPSWSGDGRTLVFTSANLASPGATMVGSELRLVDRDGRNERRLTYHCTTGASDPTYGSWLADLVLGTARPDWIDAGPGDDTVRARDGVHDTIRCGSGRDVVFADRADRVGSDCEVVRYAPSTARTGT